MMDLINFGQLDPCMLSQSQLGCANPLVVLEMEDQQGKGLCSFRNLKGFSFELTYILRLLKDETNFGAGTLAMHSPFRNSMFVRKQEVHLQAYGDDDDVNKGLGSPQASENIQLIFELPGIYLIKDLHKTEHEF